jgi:hypothetical protein
LSRDLLNSNNNQGSAADLISYAAVPGSRVSPIRQNYMQQKKILQQVYGAYRYNNIQHYRKRGEAVGMSVDHNNNKPSRLIL